MQWLSAAQSKKQSAYLRIRRLESLLNNAEQVSQLWRVHNRQLSENLDTHQGRLAHTMIVQKAAEIEEDINDILTGYKVNPAMSMNLLTGKHPLRFGSRRPGFRINVKVVVNPQNNSGYEYLFSEPEAVMRLLELYQLDGGELYRERVHRCSQCGDWFYRQHRHHRKYCSFRCQQKHFTDNEEFRMKRRLYMRNLRKTQPDAKVKSGIRAEGKRKATHKSSTN